MNKIASAEDISKQLQRILDYPDIAASGRLSAFLRFVTEEKLAGRAHEVKEYVIGVQIYGKGDAYDPRTDPTVRVDAGRLRTRLQKYYETQGQGDPILITIPKGTYVPVFECRDELSFGSASVIHKRYTWKLATGSALSIGVVGAVGMLHKASPGVDDGPRIVSLTSGLGEVAEPSFSPDGSMIAYSWNGENGDNFDIYVKVIDAPNATRLTTNPARDVAPAWSPDGKRIAFLRNPGPSGEVFVIPALGGLEQRVAASGGQTVAWTADSRGLLVTDRKTPGEPFSGFLLSLQTGEKKQLTFPPRESFYGDFDFAVSPDGSTIAFSRQIQPPVTEIWSTPAAGGAAHKVTQSNRFVSGLAWTPNSREIVFSSRQSGVNTLWRVNIKPSSVPSLIPGVETDAVRPTVPRLGAFDRIAYQRTETSYRMWRAAISRDRMSTPETIFSSLRVDGFPQISPDGLSLVFASDRTGNFDIWVGRLDGSELRNLTAGRGLSCGSPRWSPDGKTIAFDGHPDGQNPGIYLISSSGDTLRRLTDEGWTEVRPSWSQDSRWIYFSSDRTGESQILKRRPAGGAAVQVTHNGGFEAFESPDGSILYCVKRGTPSNSLWRMPPGGGEERFVSDAVHEGRWSVTRTGILFIDPKLRVCRLEANDRSTCIGAVSRQGNDSRGLTVSRDGETLVYVQPEPSRTELRMVIRRQF